MRTMIFLMSFITVNFATISTSAAKTDTALIIGGGNVIENSQSQIEENVIWLHQILRKKIPDTRIYFGSGSESVADVVFRRERRFEQDWLDILYRPAGEHLLSPFKHRIADALSGTDKATLTKNLSEVLTALPEQREVLLTYNGHGGLHPKAIEENYLKLWNDTELSISEIDALLDQAPPSTTVRFVATQCYSGAFSKLTLTEPYGTTLGEQQRCGFMAESAYRESEGCDLETNLEEFRDYTTYFYSALDGRSRTGQSLNDDFDLDKNQRINFREAHLYTLATAHSGDLSRATSEIYLEEWEPWYLRWSSWITNPKSIYHTIAEQVQKRYQIPESMAQLHQLRREFKLKREHNKQQQRKLLAAIGDDKKRIQEAIEPLWPELQNKPHQHITDDTLAGINEAIIKHPLSESLKNNILKLDELRQQELNQRRDFTQIDKVIRLRKLARLELLFDRFASSQQKADYARLLDCENGHL